VDLIMSNYLLNHLRDADERRLIKRSLHWLSRGGRLVIGDIMFGRGADAADREFIRQKVRVLVRQGPGGWWCVAKNGWRFLLRFQETPLKLAAWESITREAGVMRARVAAAGRLTLALTGITAATVGVGACGGSGHARGGPTASAPSRRGLGTPRAIYRSRLSGAAEVPAGATSGVGEAIISLHGNSTVCWRFAHLHGFHDATVARIEVGSRGRTGRVLVSLSRGRRLRHRGCTRVSPLVVDSIRRDPSGYYVNISSVRYPAGAVRAQL